MPFHVCLVPLQIIFTNPKKMFQVIDSGKPADCHHHKVHSDWNQSIYSTKEEAIVYARNWCGDYSPAPEWDGSKYDYSGSGDFIEVIEKLCVPSCL